MITMASLDLITIRASKHMEWQPIPIHAINLDLYGINILLIIADSRRFHLERGLVAPA